jgi:hypothetical protein
MRTIGVISSCVDDFLRWRESNLYTTEIGTKTRIRVNDTLYVLVMKPEHVCSKLFDDVFETENAHTSSEYSKILDIIKGNIKVV